jgi:hypothetical protein
MSNLTTPFSAIIAAAAKTKPGPEVKNKVTRLNTAGHAKVLLLDCSSSMRGRVNGGRKIDILRGAIEALTLDEWRIYVFNSATRLILPNQIPEPSGGTNLGEALRVISAEDTVETLVVSDGVPDSEDDALSAAALVQGVISTLFVGDDFDSSAKNFLRRLSSAGCGKCYSQDLNAGPLILAQAIKFLGPGK